MDNAQRDATLDIINCGVTLASVKTVHVEDFFNFKTLKPHWDLRA